MAPLSETPYQSTSETYLTSKHVHNPNPPPQPPPDPSRTTALLDHGHHLPRSPSRPSVPARPFSAQRPGCTYCNVHGLGLVLCVPLQPLWAPPRPAGHPPASALRTRYSLSCNLSPDIHAATPSIAFVSSWGRPLCRGLSQHSLAFHPILFLSNAPTAIYHIYILLIYPIFCPKENARSAKVGKVIRFTVHY